MSIDLVNKKMEKNCTCTLKKFSTQAVYGKGSIQSDIIFVGEAPGKKEDEVGEPFVGASGKILDSLLSSINMSRNEVYVTNIVKYRPPDNRDPSPKEVADCLPWLYEEIAHIKPKLIATLGRHALSQFVPGQKISDSHGRTFTSELTDLGTHTVYALFHPAAALYNGSLRQTLFDDFARIPEILQKI